MLEINKKFLENNIDKVYVYTSEWYKESTLSIGINDLIFVYDSPKFHCYHLGELNCDTNKVRFTREAIKLLKKKLIKDTLSYIPDSNGMSIMSTTIKARPRKLKAKWSVEAQQDLNVFFGI
jgi:hypothetical protein